MSSPVNGSELPLGSDALGAPAAGGVEVAVVPGAHVPAVGYVRQEPAGAQVRAAVWRHGQGRGGEPGRVSRREA